jgi:hypothetical protein
MAFSSKAAFLSGFRLIRREPVAVLVWTAFYQAAGILPQMLVFAALPEPGAEGSVILTNTLTQMVLLLLCSLGGDVILGCAIMRAVLKPEDSRGWFLRIGAREGWVGLTALAALAISVAGLGPLILVSDTEVRDDLSLIHAISMLIAFLVFLGDAVATVFLLIRLALAEVMSFVERRFVLWRSWALTRGRFWLLIWIFALVGAFGIATELVTWGMFVMITGANGRWEDSGVLDGLTTWLLDPDRALVGFTAIQALAVMLAAALAATLSTIVSAGALANIYQQLTAPDAQEA